MIVSEIPFCISSCLYETLLYWLSALSAFQPFPTKSNNILFVLNKQRDAAIRHSWADEDFISANARNN